MSSHITVMYETYSTTFSALQRLQDLPHTLSLDFETQSIYSNEEREEAKQLLKHPDIDRPTERLCKMAANSSGLSFPGITKITHMILGLSSSHSIVIIISSPQMEATLLNWVVQSDHHFIVHNAGFDIKQIYIKTGQFPKDYDDTQLLAKTYINHVEAWKASVGLKELMGQYYDPKWTTIKGYDNENLKDEAFLRYCSIDAAATYLLWEQLQEERNIKLETTSTSTHSETL